MVLTTPLLSRTFENKLFLVPYAPVVMASSANALYTRGPVVASALRTRFIANFVDAPRTCSEEMHESLLRCKGLQTHAP